MGRAAGEGMSSAGAVRGSGVFSRLYVLRGLWGWCMYITQVAGEGGGRIRRCSGGPVLPCSLRP